MIKQPKDKREAVNLYKALTGFKHTSDGQVILKYLASEKNRLQEKLNKEDDIVIVRRLQSANVTIGNFLEMVEKSNNEVSNLTKVK